MMDDLYAVSVDPWDGHVSPLFNDILFKPKSSVTLVGIITISDIYGLYHVHIPHERTISTLNTNNSELKSL